MLIKSEHNDHLLEHDEEKHLYSLDGKPLTGVTTILSIGYPKSKHLIDWQVKEGAKYVIDCLSGAVLDSALVKQLIDASPDAYKIALEAAGDIGTIVHDYAYHYEAKKPFRLKEHLEQLTSEQRKAVFTALRQFKEWQSKLDDEVLLLEELVCSPKYIFAGRFDRLAKRNGVITLSDYKTSSGFFITQFIQLAAYCIAIEEWLGIVVEDIEIVRFDKKTGKLSTRNLTQLSNTLGIKNKTCMKLLKEQFVRCLETANFKQKYDKYIRK